MTQQASRAGGETMSAILAHPDPARPAPAFTGTYPGSGSRTQNPCPAGRDGPSGASKCRRPKAQGPGAAWAPTAGKEIRQWVRPGEPDQGARWHRCPHLLPWPAPR